eukprot:GHVU01136049.1.p1 GENE.GHVU01136049.1~~GHVU01136049.1.p1  ORF type:complete len:189 (-),score=26.71 GHVU01136049.1:7-516(-)
MTYAEEAAVIADVAMAIDDPSGWEQPTSSTVTITPISQMVQAAMRYRKTPAPVRPTSLSEAPPITTAAELVRPARTTILARDVRLARMQQALREGRPTRARSADDLLIEVVSRFPFREIDEPEGTDVSDERLMQAARDEVDDLQRDFERNGGDTMCFDLRLRDRGNAHG